MGMHNWMSQRLASLMDRHDLPYWAFCRMMEIDKVMRSWNSVNNWKCRI